MQVASLRNRIGQILFIPVKSLYDGQEFLYRSVTELAGGRSAHLMQSGPLKRLSPHQLSKLGLTISQPRSESR